MKNPVTDTNFERLYNWWLDITFGFVIWLHRIYAKYMTAYIAFFWLMSYLQSYIPVVIFLEGTLEVARLAEDAGSPFLTSSFLGLLATVTLCSVVAYFESKRVNWVLIRIAKSLGPMFRRRLNRVVKVDKDETVLNELNGVLDRFLKAVEAQKLAKKGTDKRARINLTRDEALAVLKMVIDGDSGRAL